MEISIDGDKSLIDSLKKIHDVKTTFDSDFTKCVSDSYSRLKRTTNVKTGNTMRAWVVKKRGNCDYTIQNDVRVGDDKYLLPMILNDGRPTVYPKKAKRLYIPISNKGSSKLSGAKIPSDFEYGIDYVLAKSSKAVKGTKFIDKEVETAANQLNRTIEQFLERI